MVSGVKCSWSNGGYLEVDLHNCHKPINYHVLFNAPGKHVFKNLTLQKGDEKVLYDGKVTVNLKVAELKREGNVVTTTVSFISVLDSLLRGLKHVIIIYLRRLTWKETLY